MRDNKKTDSKEKTILDVFEIRISEKPDQIFLRTSDEDCSFINFRGGYMVPKYILFLDELQQTSTGKPSKKEIRDLHLSTIERLEI